MHTKGKWTVTRHEEWSEWFGNITGHPDPNDPRVIRTILCLTKYCDTDEEQEANARLIAAAPDLLTSCKVMYEILATWDGYNAETKRAREAIAKAEGGE